ncbi:MAG: hypothetical protein NDJ92_07175 [Thermoanaerobaculia bacterium]|nr:hypothetical protein [Thermoanaerobaculia bacterium]
MQFRSSRKRSAGLIMGAVLVASLAHGSLFGAEHVAGTKVWLEPPAGFAAESQFPGFRNVDSGATIMVTEVPGPIDRLRSGMTKSGLAGRGMTLVETSDVKIGDHDAQLLLVSQSAAGVVFEKWIVVFGTSTDSVFIVATYPERSAKTFREPMKKAVLSARWSLGAQIGQFDGLPFRVRESAGLKIANRVSNLLILTEGGVEGTVAPNDPLLVVGASISEVDLRDLEAFSETRLQQIEQITGVKNVTGSATRVDGLSAYEIVAEAVDAKSATPLKVYQLVVADGRRYFLAQGLVGATRAEEFLSQFREVSNSLRRSD